MRILIQISIGLLVLISIAQNGNQRQTNNFTIDSAWVKIFKLSLIQKYEHRNNCFYHRNAQSQDVYLFDSNIVKNDLPKLPGVRLILISIDRINEKAKQQGEVYYIYLASLHKDSVKAKVIWHDVAAIFSRRFGKVIHLVSKVDVAEYHISAKGWIGGFTRTEVHDFIRPN